MAGLQVASIVGVLPWGVIAVEPPPPPSALGTQLPLATHSLTVLNPKVLPQSFST